MASKPTSKSTQRRLAIQKMEKLLDISGDARALCEKVADHVREDSFGLQDVQCWFCQQIQEAFNKLEDRLLEF